MTRCRRLLSRLLLISFALRALVPAGLMLQLPIAGAEQTAGSESRSSNPTRIASLGFVICPVQNPGIDLELLADSGQSSEQHQHHHKHHSDKSATEGEQDHNTVSVDRGASLCNLWSTSDDDSLLASDYSNVEVPTGLQAPVGPKVSLYQSNQFPTRLTRAPPRKL